MRRFLGLVGIFRRFVNAFADITRSLYALQNKKNKFLWSEYCSRAFDDLKPTSSPSTLLVAYYEGGQTWFGPAANYVNGPNRQITDECPATAYNIVFPNEIIGHRYILIVVAQADAKSVAHEFLA